MNSNTFGARLTAVHPDKKKLPVQPSADLPPGFQLLPHTPCLQSVGDDDDVMAKTRDNKNSFHDSTDMFWCVNF